MFKQLKSILVESYIGAIALGYLLAESVLYLVSVVAAPVTAWATRSGIEQRCPVKCLGLILQHPTSSNLSLNSSCPSCSG